MAQWWQYLRGRPFYWALDGENPAAALYMIRRVVERPLNAPARRAARLALNEDPAICRLIESLGQGSAGYDAPLWRLRLLSELGVSGDDERIAEALDHLLDSTPDDRVIAHDAILLHIAAALGYPDEPRALAAQQRLADDLVMGALPEAPQPRADWLAQCLIALAAMPDGTRDMALLRGVDEAMAALEPVALPRYSRFGFPIYDQPDGLALARAALRAGAVGGWVEGWVERVVAAQGDDGLWRLDRLLPLPEGLCWDAAEGAPSRWLTAHALFVLRAFYGE